MFGTGSFSFLFQDRTPVPPPPLPLSVSLLWHLIWCRNIHYITTISLHVTAMPTFFWTLEALNTPQLKPDKYIFIRNRLTVVLWLLFRLKTELIVKIYTCFLLSYLIRVHFKLLCVWITVVLVSDRQGICRITTSCLCFSFNNPNVTLLSSAVAVLRLTV